MPFDSSLLLQAALSAAERGWRVIPLHSVTPSGGCTCKLGVECGTNTAKHPRHKDWQTTPPMSGEDVLTTWGAPEPPNLGIATGEASGIWVLDIDPDKGGQESMSALTAGRSLPRTRIVVTGRGGWHIYFAMPTDRPVRNRNPIKGFPGLDVRGTGGQVVAPPSVSGFGPYVEHNASVDTVAEAPDWLLDVIAPLPRPEPVPPREQAPPEMKSGFSDRLAKYTDAVVKAEIQRLDESPDTGYRNATLFAVTCQLMELAQSPWAPYTVDQALADLQAHAPIDPTFTQAEADKTIASASNSVAGKTRDMPAERERPTSDDPLDPNFVPDAPRVRRKGEPAPVARSWDDIGNAQRMVDYYQTRLRWVEQAGKWAVYARGRWELDQTKGAHALAQQMIEGLIQEEGPAYDGDQRKAFGDWVRKQRMSQRVAATIKEASARPEFQATMGDFDSDPWLFNAANGVVDLRTLEVRPHDPALMLMQQSPIPYDPQAPALGFMAFLEQMQPDQEMRNYLQRITGYSATGSIGEQVMFLHHGVGSNGKSVYLELMSGIFGDYGQVVPRDALLLTTSTQHPEGIARMAGKRFLQMSETAPGRRLNEEVLKGLTGGELQTARHMFASSFDFRPTGKIHYVTNHLPRLTNAESTWRRIRLVAWRQKVNETTKRTDLAQELLATEAPGILRWVLEGCRYWQEYGLAVPTAAVRDAAIYRQTQDEYAEFIADCLESSGDPESFCAAADIYQAYRTWAFRHGIARPIRSQDLLMLLEERGIAVHRTAKTRGFRGVRVAVDPHNVYKPEIL